MFPWKPPICPQVNLTPVSDLPHELSILVLCNSFHALVGSSGTANVCPVLTGDGAVSGNDAVIQVSAAVPGEFYVSGNLNQAVLSVTNINISQECFCSLLPCDRLLISRIGEIMGHGDFMVRYVPAEGGENITVTVLYG